MWPSFVRSARTSVETLNGSWGPKDPRVCEEVAIDPARGAGETEEYSGAGGRFRMRFGDFWLRPPPTPPDRPPPVVADWRIKGLAARKWRDMRITRAIWELGQRLKLIIADQ